MVRSPYDPDDVFASRSVAVAAWSLGTAMSEGPLWLKLLVAVLATWRVTHLLASEDGPADGVVRFRVWLGPGILGSLMDCFNCLSISVAAVAAVFVCSSVLEWLAGCLAISGGACLLERIGREPLAFQPLSQLAEGDVNHVLRSKTNGATDLSIAEGGSESPGGCGGN